MKRVIPLVTMLVAAVSVESFANVEFSVRQDDFSNEGVTTLRVNSMERKQSALFIACFPSGVSIQLAFNGVIFPDTSTGGAMQVSVTHKFDTAESAHTTDWHMNFMKYENAWFRGNSSLFLREAMAAGQLNMRLNRSGDIVRFDFSKAVEHLRAVRDACTD